MSKKWIAVVSLAFVTAAAAAAPSSDWKDVSTALKGIYTHAGISVLARLNACKIKPQKTASWVELLSADKQEYGAKKGETIVFLKMDFPPVPAIGGYPARAGQSGVSALWIVGKNRIIPVSSWAEMLQTKDVPLAVNYGMKC